MSSSTPETPRKKRLLFLHGMFLPPECYTDKLLKQFFETIADEWDLTCPKSPRVCPVPPPDVIFQMFPELKGKDLPEWINSYDNDDGTKVYHGLDDSLAFVRDILLESEPFDAVAGHSNGALLTSILSFKLEADEDWLPKDKHWKKAVLFNAPGSYSNEVNLSEKVRSHGPCKMPSVHVMGGLSDIHWEGQQKLQKELHPDAKVIVHDAGHFFPSDQKFYDEIAAEMRDI